MVRSDQWTCSTDGFAASALEQQQIVRLEALVMWTESLRDTITARASLEQAIPATAHNAPDAIRPALARLTGLVRARVPLDRALLGGSGVREAAEVAGLPLRGADEYLRVHAERGRGQRPRPRVLSRDRLPDHDLEPLRL